MGFRLQHLSDDDKIMHALRFEVLEQVCPRELVSQLLTNCRAWEERERRLNHLIVVYYVIALSLFRRLNLAAVLRQLAAGIRWLWPDPSLRLPTAAALVYRRRQLETPVMRHLFQHVCRPMATAQTKGAFRFGLRLLAGDSTLDEVPDTPANASSFGRLTSGKNQSPFPQVRCFSSFGSGHPCHCRCGLRPLSGERASRELPSSSTARCTRGCSCCWIVASSQRARLEQPGPSAARACPRPPQSRSVYPGGAGPLRWQLFDPPASIHRTSRTSTRH